MKNKRIPNYKHFEIFFDDLYGIGERWYISPNFNYDVIPIDLSHKGFDTRIEAKAAIDAYWKALR